MDTSCQLLFEMIANCNTMIAINQNSIDEIQEKHNHTTANIEQIDALISKVKDLDTRLDDTECTSTDQLIKFEDEVVMDVETVKDTSKTFDKHLHSLDNRVSSIEHLCGIRSSSSSSSMDTSRDDLSVDTFSISTTSADDIMDMSISSDSSCVESDTEESRGDESQDDTSLLEGHDDDAVATLRHMRSLESEYDDEDDAVVGSDFTDDSSDEESLCFSMMDDDDGEEEGVLPGCTTRRPRKSGLPDCSILGCTRVVCTRGLCRKHAYGTKKCSVDGCKANAYRLGLCSRHYQPCSKPGCTKHGQFVSDNGRYCFKHARTEAPEEYRYYLANLPRCSILGCNNRGRLFSNGGTRFCVPHAKTGAPEAFAQYWERRNRRYNERWRTDPEFRLRMLLSRRLNHALKAAGTSYKGKLKLLDCSVDQFKRYLEQFFSEPGNRWMNWDNQGRIEGVRCWEIDHIKPLSSFKLTNPEELKRAQHWSNFQPLSAADNNDKRAKVLPGFEWNGSRWMWSEESGRINYELPAANAEDDESDEFDESSDEID